MAEEEEKQVTTTTVECEKPISNVDNETKRKEKRKRRLVKETEKADRRGVCYLSRVPPHMDPATLRKNLARFGDIRRLYLAPKGDSAMPVNNKKGEFKGKGFTEAWVEFTDKGVAKRVANMLNGEQIGGRKRSSFYYDLWNIKYLSKFKWDDLTEELAHKRADRAQRLKLEEIAAKRERDIYLEKEDKSKARNKMAERLKKKKKIDMVPKVVRQFPQKKPVANGTGNDKDQMSRDVLKSVFGGTSS